LPLPQLLQWQLGLAQIHPHLLQQALHLPDTPGDHCTAALEKSTQLSAPKLPLYSTQTQVARQVHGQNQLTRIEKRYLGEVEIQSPYS
jgi:hypothetical protein